MDPRIRIEMKSLYSLRWIYSLNPQNNDLFLESWTFVLHVVLRLPLNSL